MRADVGARTRQTLTAEATGKPTKHCPICGKITTRANLCSSCAAGRSSRRNSKPRAPRKAPPWQTVRKGPDEPKRPKRDRIPVRTVLHVDSPDPDDPARAVAVDAILARRRTISRKGAR